MEYVIRNYIIRKSISYLENIFGLCNPEANNTYEKKISRLYNPEVNFESKKKLSDYVIRNIEKDIFEIRKIYGVAQEGMEV